MSFFSFHVTPNRCVKNALLKAGADKEYMTKYLDELVFDSCRYTKLEKACQSRDTAIHLKWRSAYKIRG